VAAECGSVEMLPIANNQFQLAPDNIFTLATLVPGNIGTWQHFYTLHFALYTFPACGKVLVCARPDEYGRISVFHRPSFVMETTKTTFKNNLVLRAHLEHSHFQNRYSLWIGKWARAS